MILAKDPRLATGELSANEFLQSSAIHHAHFLERLKAGEAKRILELLDETLDDVLARVQSRLSKYGWGADTIAGAQSSMRTRRYAALIEDIGAIVAEGMQELRGKTEERLTSIGRAEAAFQARAVANAMPIEFNFTLPSPQLLRSIVTARPMRGFLLRDWWADRDVGVRAAIKQEINLGLVEGESIAGIVARLRGTPDAPGALRTARRHVEAVVRTAVNHVTTHARESTYEENDDLVKGVKWVSTLDVRTCFAAGTPVRLWDGSTRAIERIAPGDFVESGSGFARRVLAIKQEIADEWREISLSDGSSVECTATHPFWTGSRWTEAQHLEAGSSISVRAMRRADGESLDQHSSFLLKGLCEGQRGEADGVHLLPLQSPVLVPQVHTEELLLARVLLRASSSGLSQASLQHLRPTVHGSEGLCRSEYGQRSALLGGMPGLRAASWDATVHDDVSVRDLRHCLSRAAVCRADEQGRGSLVLACVPSPPHHEELSDLQLRVPVLGERVACALLDGVLSQIEVGDATRGDGSGGTRNHRPAVRAGGGVRSVLDRLRGSVAATRDRGGRNVLAQEGEGPRREEVCCHRADGSVGVSDRIRPSDRSAPSCTHPGTRPEATGEVFVRSIRTVRKSAWCYDIEVESDHSYLVAGGLIAHNTAICRSLDGKVFAVGKGPRPPAHWNCRSTTSPVLKSLKELGISTKDVPEGTRASMNGQVPKSVTYYQWLKSQPYETQVEALGRTRANLFRSGAIRGDQFEDDRGRPLTIEELLGLAGKRAA
jgi:hypothetical protein